MAGSVTISFSELDTFRQCPFKHELAYKERWVPPTTAPALARGTAWHAMLEAHYSTIKDLTADALLLPGEDDGEPHVAADYTDRWAQTLWTQAQLNAYRWLVDAGLPPDEEDLLRWMYAGYVDRWAGDDWGIKAGTRILAVEHAAEVWLPTDRGGRSRFKLKLKLDLVVRIDGKLWIVDHKSGKDLPKQKELDIDDQFGLYTWGMRQLGKPVFGSIHNAARTQRNKDQDKHFQPLDERFSRARLARTDAELTHLAVDAYRAARMAYSLRPGEAPRAPNSDTCKWRCGFTEACLLGRKGLDDRGILRDTGFTQDFGRH
jgi:hypothetical protein